MAHAAGPSGPIGSARPGQTSEPILPPPGSNGHEIPGTFPRAWMGRRSDAEPVEQQSLVVAPPAVREGPGLRAPAVPRRRPAVAGPVPVGPAADRVGDAEDLGLVGRVAVEMRGDRHRAGERECRVDGRQPALPEAAAGLDVEELWKWPSLLAASGPGPRGHPSRYRRRLRVIPVANSRMTTPAPDTTEVVAGAMPTVAMLTAAFAAFLSRTRPSCGVV